MNVFPTVAQFADVLSPEPHWYNLGIFLQLPTPDLKKLELEYHSMGTQRCLIELYNSLELLNKVPSWDFLSQALRKSNNVNLANEIYTNYVLKPQKPSLSSEGSSEVTSVSDKEELMEIPSVDVPETITGDFEQLTEQFSVLVVKIINAFRCSTDINIDDLQQILFHQYKITRLPPADATVDNIITQLYPKYYCLLNYRILKFLTKVFLKKDMSLKRRLSDYESRVKAFKNSTSIGKMMQLMKERQSTLPSGCNIIKLKVRGYWDDVTLDSFQAVIKKIMLNLYRYGSQIRVDEGCIAISWIASNKLVSKANILIEDVVFQIIGILSVHIDDEVIYDYRGKGCETIEAAMLQAIEMNNTRAIELLLTMGCNPEVATYTGDNAVTTIVNIRESKKSSVDHVCIIGHNEHVEAIVDPTSKSAECSSCSINKTMNQQLLQENDTLRREQTTLYSQTDELQLTVKTKDREIEELQMKDKVTEIESLKNELFHLKEKMKIKENESTMTRLEGELNETMIEQLLQEQTTLYQSQIDNPTVKTEDVEIDELTEQMKDKGTDNQLQTPNRQSGGLGSTLMTANLVTLNTMTESYKDRVIGILDSNHDRLSSSIEPCLRMFSDKMFEKGFIDERTKNEPTDYGKVINAFKVYLDWIKDVERLKSNIKTFCDILKELGGAPRLAAEYLEKEFNRALTIRCFCGDEAIELTTRTNRNGNTGRVFYKCSKDDGEGKCCFFLWADQSDETASGSSHSSPSRSQSFSSPTTPSFSNNSNKTSQSSGRQPRFLSSNKGRGSRGRGSSSRRVGGARGGVNKSQLCKCNLPVAQRIVRQGNNSGRPFINCPKPREEQCGFFEFTDEISKRGGANLMGKRSSSMVHGDNDGPGTKKRAPPTCSICHIPGHTKKTCPLS